MNLVWKLLRRHISLPQFAGFFFANLFGMLVVLLGVQFYVDVAPVFSEKDSFINDDYLVVSKRITTVGTLSGRSNTFSPDEIEQIQVQAFCKSVGAFTSSKYKVSAAMGMQGAPAFTSEMFFESVPDEYVDMQTDAWHWTPGDDVVPVIMPRTYIALYNFGFAQSRGLPKVSDGLASMIDMIVYINAEGRHDKFKGRILGFSSRLNTILVPQSFMDWSNSHYEPGKTDEPSRLIMRVYNPTDERIAQFMQKYGYEVEDNKLDAGRATYFLKVVVGLVMLVGLLISALSFYILMLSIYLLVQKNTTKLENLLLIGYRPSQVARPYQLLTLSMNLAVLLIALLGVWCIRSYYMNIIQAIFPQMQVRGMLPAATIGAGLFCIVSCLNVWAIRHKILSIWYRKE